MELSEHEHELAFVAGRPGTIGALAGTGWPAYLRLDHPREVEGEAVEGRLDAELWAVLAGPLTAATGTPDTLLGGIWPGWGTPTFAFAFIDEPDERRRQEAERGMRADHAAQVAQRFSERYRRQCEAGPWLRWGSDALVPVQLSTAELGRPVPDAVGIGGADAHPFAVVSPADAAWLVVSNIDLPFTIVAGSDALIGAILDAGIGTRVSVDDSF